MTVAWPASDFAASDNGAAMAAWRRHGIALALVAALIVTLFLRDASDLAHIWWTSTTFGHCLFIGPVIAWLVWQRRAGLAQLTPAAWWPGLALVTAGGLGWLAGDAAAVAIARHFGLVLMLQGAVVTLLGPNVARALLFPLFYAFFLVPFGEGLEPFLQDVTVAITMPLLALVGIPAQVDGVLITIPTGWFEVAEACSGTKFVIAMVAYGTLVANVCFATWPRRIAFMAMAIVVPIIANGIRAFGTIYAAHLTSVEQATGYDHIVYGWVFFAVVMAAVIAIGWRWFDRAPDDPVFDPAGLQGAVRWQADLPVAAFAALALAASFPAWSAFADARATPLPARVALPDVAGWQQTGTPPRFPWSPHYPGADHLLQARYADGQGDIVDLSVAAFARQHEGAELNGFGIGVLRENDVWVRVDDEAPISGGKVVRITAPGAGGRPVERLVATWYRVGNVLTASPRAVKLETLKARLIGGPQSAVAIHVSVEIVPGRDPRAALARFLAAAGPLEGLADGIAGR